jgi:hypothetical protein
MSRASWKRTQLRALLQYWEITHSVHNALWYVKWRNFGSAECIISEPLDNSSTFGTLDEKIFGDRVQVEISTDMFKNLSQLGVLLHVLPQDCLGAADFFLLGILTGINLAKW